MNKKSGEQKEKASRKSKKLKLSKETIKDLESKHHKVMGGRPYTANPDREGCCDRNMKENFGPVESQEILNRLSRIPIETWNYTWDDPSVRHISPMAQAFASAFAVGEDDKHIHPIDVSGVAFASIQALFQNLQQTRLEMHALRAEVEEMRKRKD
jgi:ribosomal protein S8E